MAENCPVTGEPRSGLHCEPPGWCQHEFYGQYTAAEKQEIRRQLREANESTRQVLQAR